MAAEYLKSEPQEGFTCNRLILLGQAAAGARAGAGGENDNCGGHGRLIAQWLSSPIAALQALEGSSCTAVSVPLWCRKLKQRTGLHK
jgi:hypothetical protein